MQVWLGADGRIRGVVALDAITPEEFGAAFRRWQPTMRRIGPEEVADVVLEAVRQQSGKCGKAVPQHEWYDEHKTLKVRIWRSRFESTSFTTRDFICQRCLGVLFYG
jgi:hypothetical protein